MLVMGVFILYVNTILFTNTSTTSSSIAVEENTHVASKTVDGRNEKNIEPILKVLRQANVSMVREELDFLNSILPDWSQVVDRIGPSPIIYGLDKCEEFHRRTSGAPWKGMGPSGPFNSGTNFLHDLLNRNCIIERAKVHKYRSGVLWQVPWGKHQSPLQRFNNSVFQKDKPAPKPHGFVENANYLPIVMVRDPFTWFQSMCKTRYSAHWYHVGPLAHNRSEDRPDIKDRHRYHCPNFVPSQIEKDWYHKTRKEIREVYGIDVWSVDNIINKANFTLRSDVIPVYVKYKSEIRYHRSLAHMWIDWYEDYLERVDWPYLMVRLEDLVFYPHETVRKICECYGGGATYVGDDQLTVPSGPSKPSGTVHGAVQTGLMDAMVQHVTRNRTTGMTTDDLHFVRNVFRNSRLIQMFGYKVP
jgi:hypothetical protein